MSAPSSCIGAARQVPSGGVSTKAQSYLLGLCCCLVATVSWGCMFPIMSDALLHSDPFTFTSLRYLIAGVPFMGVLLYKEGPAALRMLRAEALRAWIVGSIGFGGFGFLVFWGQQLAGREGALIASIMMATQPMLGLIVNSIAKRALPPRFSFLFVLFSFFGAVLVVTKGHLANLVDAPQNYAANLLFILGALSFVVYTFSAQSFPEWSPFRFTAITTWLGLTTVVGINVALYLTHRVAVPERSQMLAIVPHLLYMGLIAGFVAVLCWNVGNRILTPMNGVLFMDVVPITTFVVSSLAGVVPERTQIMGACVTGAALVMNNFYLRTRARNSPSACCRSGHRAP